VVAIIIPEDDIGSMTKKYNAYPWNGKWFEIS
jgi:hypothetical protein